MREAINQGIQGFLAGCFAGGRQPLDPVTGYPLTPENSETVFNMRYPYEAIEDTFLNHVQWDENKPLDTTQLQIWVAYFWQYANLILQERFEPMPYYDGIEGYRQQVRDEMAALGYRRIK